MNTFTKTFAFENYKWVSEFCESFILNASESRELLKNNREWTPWAIHNTRKIVHTRVQFSLCCWSTSEVDFSKLSLTKMHLTLKEEIYERVCLYVLQKFSISLINHVSGIRSPEARTRRSLRGENTKLFNEVSQNCSLLASLTFSASKLAFLTSSELWFDFGKLCILDRLIW